MEVQVYHRTIYSFGKIVGKNYGFFESETPGHKDFFDTNKIKDFVNFLGERYSAPEKTIVDFKTICSPSIERHLDKAILKTPLNLKELEQLASGLS